jgi:DNA-binding transcriptional MerR regulator
MTRDDDLPDKLYFKIGEVARLVGVKPYVLRYWEAEFAGLLRPGKTQSRHRLYRRKDVETLRTIRRLLHDERYTIEGARRRLRSAESRTPAVAATPVAPPLPSDAPGTKAATIAGGAAPVDLRPTGTSGDVASVVAHVRRELRAVIDQLSRAPGTSAPLEIG